jgi:hypothetical protein
MIALIAFPSRDGRRSSQLSQQEESNISMSQPSVSFIVNSVAGLRKQSKLASFADV